MEKIYYEPLGDGRQFMFKFGYTDHNGEYYSNFADVSKANSGKGASYAAFVAFESPDNDDTNPCWSIDTWTAFMDRPLTAEEKMKFENHFMEHVQRLQAAANAATQFLLTMSNRYGFELGDNEQICSYHNSIMNAIYEAFEE